MRFTPTRGPQFSSRSLGSCQSSANAGLAERSESGAALRGILGPPRRTDFSNENNATPMCHKTTNPAVQSMAILQNLLSQGNLGPVGVPASPEMRGSVQEESANFVGDTSINLLRQSDSSRSPALLYLDNTFCVTHTGQAPLGIAREVDQMPTRCRHDSAASAALGRGKRHLKFEFLLGHHELLPHSQICHYLLASTTDNLNGKKS